MCGITGFLTVAYNHFEEIVTKMMETLHHRGPDDQGIWYDAQQKIALAQKRLAIVDVSPAGHQPMMSHDGRWVIVFNGEIYNHEELRAKLGTDLPWRGHSDTETLVESFAKWGMDTTLAKINGMFALAAWDRETQTLYLARDRMGEKPLYYGRHGQTFFFASELKALRKHPDFQHKINQQALALYLRFGYIPGSFSIYEDIFKLQPAHYIKVQNQGRNIQTPYCYWDLSHYVKHSSRDIHDDDPALVDELDGLLRKSVRLRMMSDVPLGALLSGGLDSSLITALMQVQNNAPIKTFTIGFSEERFNESQHAAKIARHLGTQHHEMQVTAQDALNVIPQLPYIYDEPFADSSQIPTYLVFKMARRHVTVTLSGDAGDELFFGYQRYRLVSALNKGLTFVPHVLRPSLAWFCRKMPGHWLDQLQQYVGLPSRPLYFGDRLPKLAEIVSAKDEWNLYMHYLSIWKTLPLTCVASSEYPLANTIGKEKLPFSERMMFVDQSMYLPDDIFVKLDRASMAVSLESRVPLVDPEVVEFVWRLPFSAKYRNGQSKWILRNVLYRYVPKQFLERPKQGFAVPIELWLRQELRHWAEDLLSEEQLSQDGFFDVATIRRQWSEHLSGVRRWHSQLWPILMYQAWRRVY